jgi:VanZ family protein
MVLIFITSSIPGNSPFAESKVIVMILRPAVQNFLHIPLFGILALLWLITFRRKMYEERLCFRMTTIISVGYGCLDEVHQYFIPGRYMSLTDVSLNIIGIFTTIGGYKYYLKKRIKS